MYNTEKIYVCELHKFCNMKYTETTPIYILDTSRRFILAHQVNRITFEDLVTKDQYVLNNREGMYTCEMITNFEKMESSKKYISKKIVRSLYKDLYEISGHDRVRPENSDPRTMMLNYYY